MKHRYKAFLFLILSGTVFGPLHSNSQIINRSHASKGSLEENAFNVLGYISLLSDAHEAYLENNESEPIIQCKKCTTKLLSLSELGGGLIGWAFKSAVDGKEDVKKIKGILDGCLKVMSDGVDSLIIDYMLYTANETKQVCSHCHEKSSSWGKMD